MMNTTLKKASISFIFIASANLCKYNVIFTELIFIDPVSSKVSEKPANKISFPAAGFSACPKTTRNGIARHEEKNRFDRKK